MKRVLFFAEAVTLAHAARPLVLGGALERAGIDVCLAGDLARWGLAAPPGWESRPLYSLPTDAFLAALAAGRPVYARATLERYVREDLALIEQLRPDLIVGDFRLSLSVSARVAGVPYATITNAYWSPALTPRWPLPVLPWTALCPLPLARLAFAGALPVALRLHARPMRALRRRWGLPIDGWGLRDVYTDADFRLYADIPGMFDIEPLPGGDLQLGPVLWSPGGALPDWWSALPADRPLVYVTLGSSGQRGVLPAVVAGLQALGVTTVVTTAGAEPNWAPAADVYWARFLPGDRLSARAALVICNGGSPACQQALAGAAPVIGIAGNMDQFLNMEAIERAGAGRLLRADRVRPAAVEAAARALLGDGAVRAAATRWAQVCAAHPAERRFARWTAQRLGMDVAGEQTDAQD